MWEVNEIVKKEKWIFTRSFEPIRYILTMSDEKFNRLYTPTNNDEKAALEWGNELLITSNTNFAKGFIGSLGHELRRTLAEFDLIQLNLSFLNSIVIDKRLGNLLEDIRMAFQNFTYNLLTRSYYSAFSEFRKILESVIWIRTITEKNNIPDRIDDESYTSQLNSISPTLSYAFKYFSRNIHFGNNPIYFNLNNFYEQEDHLYTSLRCVQTSSPIIVEEIYKVFYKFDSKSVSRYKKMIDMIRVKWDKPEYNLSDQIVSETDLYGMTNSYQIKYNEMIRLGKITEDELEDHYNRFLDGVFGIIASFPECIESDFTKEAEKFRKHGKLFLEYPRLHPDLFPFMMIYSGKAYADAKKLEEDISRGFKAFSELYIDLANLYTRLSKIEINRHGDKKVAILKTIVEDFVFNFSILKGENYMVLNLLCEITGYVDKEFYDLTVRFRHIQPVIRIKYVSTWSASETGNTNYIEKSIDVLLNALMCFIKNNPIL